MNIVEVRRPAADLRSAMAEMRTWVDRHRVEPSTFEVGFVSAGEVRFRLQFQSVGEASVFASAFDGELLVATDNIIAA